MATFAELFARHQGELYRYAARFTGDPDLAEDVVQESFLRLAARPPDRQRGERAWLFTVATRIAIDTMRRSRRRADILGRAAPDVELAPRAPDPADEAERHDLAERVHRALAALAERDRTVLLMREEGFTHREIAAAVGTTTKSVGTMISRALDRLAVTLDLDVEAIR